MSGKMSNSPLIPSTVRSHLGHITRPKDGLIVTVPAEDGLHLSEVHLPLTPVLAHMIQLDHEVAQPLDLPQDSLPGPSTKVEFSKEPLHEESDVDLESGDVRIPLVSQDNHQDNLQSQIGSGRSSGLRVLSASEGTRYLGPSSSGP